MIEAKAVVVRVEQGRAWVRVSDRQDGCGRCDEPGGCRSVKIAYAIKPPTEVFSVPDPIGVAVGDRVRVVMQDGAPLLGALASYGLGAVLLLAGAGVGHLLATPGAEDLFALVGALLGVGGAFAVHRGLHRSRRWRGALKIELVRDEGPCPLESGTSS